MGYTFLPGRTALVTGAARGQGRAHAVTLASHGVDVAVLDICAPVETVPYKAATREDLDETVRLIEKEGARALPFVVDVRDLDGMQAAARSVVDEWRHIDYLVANAGILNNGGKTHEITKEQWDANIGVHLTGVWNSLKAVLPYMVEAGFGRIVGTTSGTIRHTGMHVAAYAAGKAGILSLMRSVAVEYADKGITANSISPSNVGTDMILNDMVYKLYAPDIDNPQLEDVRDRFASVHLTGIGYIQPEDVSQGVAFLLSEEGRFCTGIELPMLFGRTGGL